MREKCYRCYRPKESCMCLHVRPIQTRTKFVILMHPKEYKKVKNGTGHLTHLSLPNSEIHIGIDFSYQPRVNELLDDEKNLCYLLYPSQDAIEINTHKLTCKENSEKNVVIFIIDSTWACAKKMMRLSPNIAALQAISFTHATSSAFAIKEQPAAYCLSTIESVLTVLKLMDKNGDEAIGQSQFEQFLNPFLKMIEFQIEFMEACKAPRFVCIE